MRELVKRTEVLYLLAHLSITVMVLGSYVFLKTSGHDDQTLESLILIIGGWWFGAMGKATVADTMSKKTTVISSTETEIEPTKPNKED